jgi:hypothetical protein
LFNKWDSDTVPQLLCKIYTYPGLMRNFLLFL